MITQMLLSINNMGSVNPKLLTDPILCIFLKKKK